MPEFWFGVAIGVLAAGALMYYIQPAVKDFVSRAFVSAPAMIKQAEALQQRAEAILSAARSK